MKLKHERGKKEKRKRPACATKKPALAQENAAAAQPFFVAGLGASAGGLEALGSFFEAMSDDSGIGFVVIQHLSPDHKSMMSELLARNTRMPVCQAEDGMPVEPNHVYLIPPKKCLTLFKGHLMLADWDSKKGPNLPIDLFFSSLAGDCGERAIGIALSGTGSDGTRGIRSIKEAGGLVMIQDEHSAKFSGMPHSAIATGLADFILPASDMPDALLKFIKHPLLAQTGGKDLQPSSNIMQKIQGLIRTETGIDFSGYKQSSLVRRIERRMGISQVKEAGQYFEYLRQSPQEITAIVNDLLISVTRFFRDSEAFACLRDKVIPVLFAHASKERTVRVWVPGCATGEEAYSIAILMAEHAATLGEQYDVRIFATDVNKKTIEFAAAGIYPGSIAADIPKDLLARYFMKVERGWQICRRIREQVVFARQNILTDPPFTRMDLVSCRNLLIYLQSPMQHKVLSLLRYALRSEGWMFLGSSETVGEHQDIFAQSHVKARIFQKRGGSASTVLEIARSAPASAPARETLSVPPHGGSNDGKRPLDKLWNAINAKLIADFAPTCFAVNEKDEILYSFGQPQAFIALQTGRAHLNLLKLVPRDLSLALSTAIREARKQYTAVHYRSVKFRKDHATVLLDLKIEPMPGDGDAPAAWLVFLEKSGNPATAPEGEDFDPGNRSTQRIADLEDDLQISRENLQAAIEQKETSAEELQASNEELMAANEELQSSNEELESVNEEQATLNSEYQQKNDELLVANNDIDNFLRTAQIGTIFLDKTLHIRKFTPVVAEEMKLLPHDAGRLLTDLSHPLIHELSSEVQRVLRDKAPVEKTVETRPGVWHLLRISPYRREGTTDEGIVVTFVNVSVLKQAQHDLQKNSQQEKR